MRNPHVCHVSSDYVRIDQLKSAPVPVLFIRGMRMNDSRISFELVSKGNGVRLPGDPEQYLVRDSHKVGLDLRRLANDGLLSCAVEKIRYGWYVTPSTFHSVGGVFTGCDPPPLPTCPGGAAQVNGLCNQCKFDINVDAGGTSTWMFPAGSLPLPPFLLNGRRVVQHPGLQRHVMLQFKCPMQSDKRIRVRAYGDVTVESENQSQYGHWPRWLSMNLNTEDRTPSRALQAICSDGLKAVYDVQIQGNHKVSMCGELVSDGDGDVDIYVAIERCKQGDDRASCRLENNWKVDITTL